MSIPRPGQNRTASIRGKPLASALLLIVSVLVALLLAEVVLRLAGQSYYWAIGKRPDPELGWRPPPNAAAWQRFEGAALVETNGLGFRDRDHPLRGPDGGLRIAVLGDSFTEAVQVPIDRTWWRRMESILNAEACGGAASSSPVEVLNFAVSGYSSAQSLLAMRRYALRFAPDVVLLAFFTGNDLVENSPELDADPMRPYVHRDGVGGGLRIDRAFLQGDDYRAATSWRGRIGRWFVERSRLLQLWQQARDAVRQAEAATVQPSGGVAQEPGVDNRLYSPPQTEAWRDAWARTELILAAFAEEARAAGAQPVLLIIGTAAMVHPDGGGVGRFAASLGVEDLGYPVRRLIGLSAALGVPALNLPAIMADRAEREGTPLHGFEGAIPGFGHWNIDGHEVAGQAAARLICELRAAETGSAKRAARSR
jgi:hypothetical protein